MNLLQVTKRLVEIDTSSGGSSETVAAIEELLPDVIVSRRPSASPGSDDDLLFSRLGSGRARVLLLGHYDTVAVSKARTGQDAGLLYGPGVFDMKGGLAIALKLFRDTDSANFSSLEFLACGDEETRQRPMHHPGEWEAILAFEGGEPEGVVLSRFGASELKLTVNGKPLRATFPLKGKSVLSGINESIRRLESENRPECHFTASSVTAPSPCNVVAGEFEVGGVLRYRSAIERQHWLATMSAVSGSLESRELIPPLLASAASRKLLADAGIPSVGRSGSSDIAWLSSQAPILIDGFGPYGGGEHSRDEFIEIESLERQYRLVEKVLSLLCQGNNALGDNQ